MTAVVQLTRGYEALVDSADYEGVVAAGPWRSEVQKHTVYALRHIRRPDGTLTSQSLHSFLTGWLLTDHRDGDGLNNQRANLRPATPTQNCANARTRSDNTSGYKGVSWHRQKNRWQAHIGAEGRRLRLGLFDTAKGAALAYDAAAFALWGEYAWLNRPDALIVERIDAARERLVTKGVRLEHLVGNAA